MCRIRQFASQNRFSKITRNFIRALCMLGGLWFSWSPAFAQNMVTFAGTIALPPGQIAPAGGITLQVQFWDTFLIGSENVDVVIPAGGNSIGYTSMQNDIDWIFGYECISGCDGFTQFGYVSNGNMIYSIGDAAIQVAGSDRTNIGLELIPSRIVAGELKIPGGAVAPAGGYPINVIATNEIYSDPVFFFGDIAQDGDSMPYTLILPDDGALEWLVQFSCVDCDGYMDNVFYAAAETSPYQSDATLLRGDMDYVNVDAELIGGITITGSFDIPSELLQSPDGFALDVTADNISNNKVVSRVLFFDSGTPTDYLFTIPADSNASWQIGYACSDPCDDYLRSGFYSDAGTVSGQTPTLLAGGADHTDIDMALIPANVLSGSISLPDGFDTSTGVELFVTVSDYDVFQAGDNGFIDSFSLIFNPGEGELPYSINIPDVAGTRVMVEVSCDVELSPVGACDGFVTTYFSAAGSTFDSADATPLAGTSDQTDIDIGLVPADLIFGQISLPGTDLAPAGGVEISVSVFLLDEPFEFSGFTSVFIDENTAVIDYRVQVPSDLEPNNWNVIAECFSGCAGYEERVYYADTGTTTIGEQATPLPNTGDYPGIDIELLSLSNIAAFQCTELVDDFSAPTLELEKWFGPAFAGELDNGMVRISQSLISPVAQNTFGSDRRFNLNLLTFPASHGADVALRDVDLTDSGSGLVFASVRGSYYYTLDNSADYDNNLGEVFASISIGDRGDGLEAWYEILEGEDSGFETAITHAEGAILLPGVVEIDQVYAVRIDYDAVNNSFDFWVDDQTASAAGPAAGSAIVPDSGLFRGFTAGAVPEENTDTDPISVVATFDNVEVNGSLFDDFSADSLDPAKWEEVLRKREIVDGKMVTEVTSVSADRRSVFSFPLPSRYAEAPCLQGDLAILSESDAPLDSRFRNRLNGYWFNAIYNEETGYTGLIGEIFAQILIERTADGRRRATLYAEEVADENHTSGTQLAFHTFDTPVVFNQEYTAAIMLDTDDKALLFRFEDEVFRLPVLTDINPSNPEVNFVGFTTRVESGPGFVKATLDNVYATPREVVVPETVVEDNCFPVVTGRGAIAVICL